MNKQQILSRIDKHYEKEKQRSLKSAEKLFNYILKKRTDGKNTIIKGKAIPCNINNCDCLCTYWNFLIAEAWFMPLLNTDNLGTEYAGGILEIKY